MGDPLCSLLIAKNLKSNDPEGLERAYRAYNAAFPEVPYPNAEGVKTLLDDIAPRTPKAATADPKSFVDMSLAQELEASVLSTSYTKGEGHRLYSECLLFRFRFRRHVKVFNLFAQDASPRLRNLCHFT
jgi:hypothetical protein